MLNPCVHFINDIHFLSSLMCRNIVCQILQRQTLSSKLDYQANQQFEIGGFYPIKDLYVIKGNTNVSNVIDHLNQIKTLKHINHYVQG